MLRSFHKLTPSERRLAGLAVACLIAAIALAGYRVASDRLALMDATIGSMQQELLAYEGLIAQAEPVNQAFNAMASQHSSEWTQEEIHDRLRREITRLSLRQIPPPGSPIPAATNAGDQLVSIPQMPMGSLVDHEAGYRSYQINFKTDPASIQNIALFVERLQRSDQALRIDSLDIVRQPLANVATANMRVTRTVIDNVARAESAGADGASSQAPAAAAAVLKNPGFEEWDATTNAFPSWTAVQCQVTQHGAQATEGVVCARIQGTDAGGSFYQPVEVTAGATYDLQFDAFAWGDARVEIVDDASGQPFNGAPPLKADGSPNRYHLRFTVPGEPGQAVTLRVPDIVLKGADAIVLLDNVSLTEAPGGS